MNRKTVITIARQFGSGGREIGKKLAQELSIPFYDKELITLAAKESGMSPEIFENIDETAASSLLYSLAMGAYSMGNRVPASYEMPMNDKLFLIQADMIKKLDVYKRQVSSFVGYLKGKSTLMIYEQFPNLKYKYRNRGFWCRGYYVDTVGKNESRIAEYIENQLKEEMGEQLANEPIRPVYGLLVTSPMQMSDRTNAA